MPDIIEILIPLVSIIGGLSIPVFYFYFDSRNKASRDKLIGKALEAGVPLEEVKHLLADKSDYSKSVHKVPFRKGLVLISIGAALLISRQMGLFPSSDAQQGGVLGMIVLFLGIALFISDIFNRHRFNDRA